MGEPVTHRCAFRPGGRLHRGPAEPVVSPREVEQGHTASGKTFPRLRLPLYNVNYYFVARSAFSSPGGRGLMTAGFGTGSICVGLRPWPFPNPCPGPTNGLEG